MTAPARTADVLLRRTATALRSGQIAWGRDYFIDPASACRCTLGAIAYAADPADPDGDPTALTGVSRSVALEAIRAVELYLADELALPGPEYVDIGVWNDRPECTVDQVITTLEAAADRITPTAVPA